MLGKKKGKCPAESKNLILINRFSFDNARCEVVKFRWSVSSVVHFVVLFCLSSWVSFEYTPNDLPPPPARETPICNLKVSEAVALFYS